MSVYVNRFDKNKECARQGQKAEKTFKDVLINEGFEVKNATRQEQFAHVDLLATKKNKTLKFEVKARKRISRQDSNYQDDFVWIEILNVNGDAGWLYGKADFVVFEREKDFVLVNRQKLADFVANKCNLAKVVGTAREALYANYQRQGRYDCLTLIKNKDIEALAHRFFLK